MVIVPITEIIDFEISKKSYRYVKFVYTVFSGTILICANILFIKKRFYKYKEKLETILEITIAKSINDCIQVFPRLIF